MKTKSILWGIVAALCIGAVLYSSFMLYTVYDEYKSASDEYDKLSQIAHNNNDTDEDTPSSNESPTEGANAGEASEYVSPINFADLQAINPDIVGWIIIDGTNIDYPILQGTDNSQYLNTTYMGESLSSGSIFLDYRNSANFTDSNSIIYGHKMRNGTMFHDLSEYKSQVFWNEHPTFTIYTSGCEYQCEVFSAYVTSAASETYVLDFEDAVSYVRYLNTAIDKSLIKTGTVVYSTDWIVTLSTCDYTYNNARMVVHARISVVQD